MIKHKPINNVEVKKIMSFDIFASSFFAKRREIKGDVLNKVHPIPKGSVLKTTC